MSIFARKSKTQELTDTVLTESVAASQIDRENSVIKGVKVLGLKSENGREYSQKAREQARDLYEGIEVNVDHLERDNLNAERGVSDGWGMLKESRLDSSGNYADLHFLKNHPSTELFLERVERGFPIGLSHHANGKLKRRGNRVIVESIGRVRSVDLVRKPATNTNLFESIENTMPTTLREAIEATGYKHTKALLEALPEEVSPEAEVEMPAEGEGDATQGVVDSLAAEAAKIIADPKIDSAMTLAKVKSIVKTVETVKKDLGPESAAPTEEAPEEGSEGEEDDEEKKKALTESTIAKAVSSALKPLQESIGTLQFEQKRSDLLTANGVNQTNLLESQRDELAKQTTEKGVEEFIESLPPAYRGYQGVRTAPKHKSGEKVPVQRMRRRG